MRVVRGMIQEHYYTVVLLLLVGGFAMLLAELLMLGHTDGIQLLAVAATIIGLILTLAALFVRGRAAMAVAVMLILLSVSGVVGVYEHLEQRESDSEERASIQTQPESMQPVAFTQDEDAPKPDSDARPAGNRADGGTPPPLAPLSLAGLSIMGAVTILGTSRKEA